MSAPTLINGPDAVTAWLAGAQEVLRQREVFNLVTTIEHPCVVEPQWLTQYSPRARSLGREDIRDVVDTIFPLDLARRYPERQEFYSQYLRRHDRAMRMRRNASTWGTYFERLIRFPGSDANQLEQVIDKLTTWQVRSTTALVFHLSTPAIDRPRTRGGPCWHFGEVIWNRDDTLDLVVVYRNHDFFNKALGNFLALGQLLRFICEASGKESGQLVSHSIHAYNGGLVSTLREMMG